MILQVCGCCFFWWRMLLLIATLKLKKVTRKRMMVKRKCHLSTINFQGIRLMEKILHHLGCPERSWYQYATNIWSILSGAGLFPSTVFPSFSEVVRSFGSWLYDYLIIPIVLPKFSWWTFLGWYLFEKIHRNEREWPPYALFAKNAYISCMDTAYVREFTHPQNSLHF